VTVIRPRAAGEGDHPAQQGGGGGAAVQKKYGYSRAIKQWLSDNLSSSAVAPSTIVLRTMVPLPRYRGGG